MYTQALDLPPGPEDKAQPVRLAPSADEASLQAQFDRRIDADGRIEPQDWMPEACLLYTSDAADE